MNSAISERKAFYTKLVGIALPVVFQGLLNNSLSFVDTVIRAARRGLDRRGGPGQPDVLPHQPAYFGVCSGASIFLSPVLGAGNRTNIEGPRPLGLVAGIAAR